MRRGFLSLTFEKCGEKGINNNIFRNKTLKSMQMIKLDVRKKLTLLLNLPLP